MTKDRNSKRPSIYLNPPLERVQSSLGTDQSLSRRLGEIVERYELIITNPPTLTERERAILVETFADRDITPLVLKYLHDELIDHGVGDFETEVKPLAARIDSMILAKRVALIESLGL